MDGRNGNGRAFNTLLALPTELLVHIALFLTEARDKANLRYVSRRLRSVSETPSLWNEFVWPYYHTADEGCVNNVLKMCGSHLKRLSFPHHMTSSKLTNMLEYCSNVIELSLPTTNLYPEQLGKTLLAMKHLQNLTIQWNTDIKHLLEVVVGTNMQELMIVVATKTEPIVHSTKSWIHYWMVKQFVPQKLNIYTAFQSFYRDYKAAMWNCWISTNSKSPAHSIGHLKLYNSMKVPLNFSPVLPAFQLEFGQDVDSPFVNASSIGILGLNNDLLELTDCTCNGKMACKAKVEYSCDVKVARNQVNHRISNLEFVTDFDVMIGWPFCSEQLEQLAVTCLNLQRLNLYKSMYCLKSLQGLRAIATFCNNLQGLNLSGIPVSEVEDQTQLWEILSDMKLTHLAIDFCVLLPSAENKQKLIVLFQKCTQLQALQCDNSHCLICDSKFVDISISVLSQFKALMHYIIFVGFYHSPITLQGVLTTCKELKYLNYTTDNYNTEKLSSLTHNNLQQIRLKSISTVIPNSFMSTISSHGGLVHVVLCVRSVTSEGVTVVVSNSPNLLTFHAIVHVFMTKMVPNCSQWN